MEYKYSNRKIRIIILIMFFMNIGFYMLIPYLSVYLTDSFGLAGIIVGFIMAIRLFSQQGLTFVGGAIADKIGIRKTIIIGTVIRSIGFLLFGVSNGMYLLILAAVFTGFGGALFTPATRTALTLYSSDDKIKKKTFSTLNIADNSALALGPLIGLVLIQYNWAIISIVSSMIYLIAGIVAYLIINKSLENINSSSSTSILSNMAHVLKQRTFILTIAVTIPYFYTAQQVYLLFPVVSERINETWLVSLGFLIIALTVVVGQKPLDKIMHKFITNDYKRIIVGYLVLCVFIFPNVFIVNKYTLILFIMGVAFSIIIIGPTINVLVTKFSTPKTLSSFFGFSTLSAAIGGAFGNLFAGALIDLITISSLNFVPWLIILITNIFSVLFIYSYFIRKQRTSRLIGL
ncbi:MFS transporter [Shouchella sp. 1P09AA]|uniref:MFS transporter n=1 Tax=unclassified Shouchella TaxID=2893065 RepID=UPI0039A1C749